MWEKMVKLGSGHVFLVLGAHVKVLTLINELALQCKLYMNINDVYSCKSEITFYVHVNIVFVLTLTVQFDIWTLSDFKGIF